MVNSSPPPPPPVRFRFLKYTSAHWHAIILPHHVRSVEFARDLGGSNQLVRERAVHVTYRAPSCVT